MVFHLWNEWGPDGEPRLPEPALLAARHGGGTVADRFVWTPLGATRRAQR
ncbi:hypothetical protein AB0A74_07995 [Saccharothrix sp. NPDC042600]|nr:hypothetical protein GCM10017745_79700 [Saccharothrix mutabilis subsp. capreolus]